MDDPRRDEVLDYLAERGGWVYRWKDLPYSDNRAFLEAMQDDLLIMLEYSGGARLNPEGREALRFRRVAVEAAMKLTAPEPVVKVVEAPVFVTEPEPEPKRRRGRRRKSEDVEIIEASNEEIEADG